LRRVRKRKHTADALAIQVKALQLQGVHKGVDLLHVQLRREVSGRGAAAVAGEEGVPTAHLRIKQSAHT
jgi:hypothetical protein